MTALDRLNHRATTATHRIALVGFTGLVLIALLTFYDGAARYLDLPRVSGFSDVGELLFPIIIASCFPAAAHPAEKSHHQSAGSGGRRRHRAMGRSGRGGCRAHFLHALRPAVCADDPRLPCSRAHDSNHRDPDGTFLDDRHIDTVALCPHPATRCALAATQPVTTMGQP